MAMFGGITVLPLYMQIVHGATPMKAGLMMLPMVVGMMSASIFAGQVTSRTGKIRIFPIIGSAFATVALLLLSQIGADTHLVLVMAAMFMFGLGLGQCMQPLTIIVQNAVPPSEIGVATSSATFFRQLGGTLGVAAFLSILFSTVGDNIKTAFSSASRTPAFNQALHDPTLLSNPTNAQVAQGLKHPSSTVGIFDSVQNNSSVINKMADVFAHPFKVGFAQSMDSVFLIAGCISVLAVAVLLLMPKVELRATSASAAARAQAQGVEPPPVDVGL
jgi:hypothetical protein